MLSLRTTFPQTWILTGVLEAWNWLWRLQMHFKFASGGQIFYIIIILSLLLVDKSLEKIKMIAYFD